MGQGMDIDPRTALESHSAAWTSEEVGQSRRRPLPSIQDRDLDPHTTGRISGRMQAGYRGGSGAALAVACALLVIPAAAGHSEFCFAGPASGLTRGLKVGAMRMPVLSLRPDSSSRGRGRGGGRGSSPGRGAASSKHVCGASMIEAEDKVLNSRRIARWADGLLKEDARLLGSRRVARSISSIMGRKRVKESSGQIDGGAMAGSGLESGKKVADAAVGSSAIEVTMIGEQGDEIVGSVAAAAVAAVRQETAIAVAAGSLGASSSSSSSSFSASSDEKVAPAASNTENVGKKTEEVVEEWGSIFAAGAPPARPSNIPELTAEDEELLLAGERVQRQTRDGRVGQGMVVVDVKADISTVFAVLTDIERYTERISTVRRCNIYERGQKTAKATFAMSRFMLTVNTVLRCERARNILTFEIDEERPTPIMEEAKGQWFLEMAPERQGDDGVWTRVWLTSSIKCSPLLPTFLIDYAASRALPRATRWLKPTIEAIADQLPEGAGNVREAHIAALDEASEL